MYEDFIAKRITELRNIKKVSAREMSLDIGQNPNYINRIENKKTLPSIQGLFYICEYFGITPEEFFAENNANPAMLNSLMAKIRNMSGDQLVIVEEIVDSAIKLKNK